MSPSIDVVIPTHGRWDLTQGCLILLREQTARHTVTVADNGSTDGTPNRVRELFPEVRLVELGANLGFPVACNRGAEAGSGDVIVLLNNDVEMTPDFLRELAEPFAGDPRLGSVSPVLVRPGTSVIDSVGLTADATLAGFPRLRGRPVDHASAVAPAVSGPTGAAGAYRRAAWDEVGGLDEGVRFYGEDLDLALRLRSAGWKTTTRPETTAIHLGSATFGARTPWQRYQSGFSRGYFIRRYGLLGKRSALRVLITEGIVAVGDAMLARDLSAARGRLAGWRSAHGLPKRDFPPAEAIESAIGFWDGLRLRRQVYSSLEAA